MNRSASAALICLAALGALSAHADITYPTPGIAIASTTFTATTTGTLTGYFLGGDAGGEDTVRLIDETSGFVGTYTMDNKTSTLNQAFSFGPVTKGDVLAFQIHDDDLYDPNGIYLTNGFMPNPVDSSDAKQSSDGISHTYATPYSGTINGLTGLTYVGFEDLPKDFSDLDYNDFQFALGGVSANSTVTPEPGTFMLLGTGLAGMAGALRRRFTR